MEDFAPATGIRTVRTAKQRAMETCKHGFVCFILLFAFFPLYLMLNISLKDNVQFVNNPWTPQAPFHWENWVGDRFGQRIQVPGNTPEEQAMAKQFWFRSGWDSVKDYVANTIVVAVSAVVGTLACGLGAAYFFARYRMPGSRFLFALFMALMLMPGVATLIPLFNLLQRMELLNTLWCLIILGTSGGQVICIFILRNFIEDIPKDLFEAAEIDGASHLQQIWNIVIPQSGPILATLGILRFIAEWNEFIMPLIVLRDDKLQMISVGLMRLEGEYTKLWGPLMAGYSVAAVPLVLIFLFTMRLFVRGLSAGAIKG